MSEESEKQRTPRIYTPKEVAKMFGISVHALKSRRQRGQIQGTHLDEKTVVYTEEQVRSADLSPRKRGPKPGKHKERKDDEETYEGQLLCAV